MRHTLLAGLVFVVAFAGSGFAIDQATWDIVPTATGANHIVMKAALITGDVGSAFPPAYQFECIEDAVLSSGWQTNPLYIATSAAAGTTYTFRLRYRDGSPQQTEGPWSTSLTITTASGQDNLPPAPNPSRWAATPRRTGLLSSPKIYMEAQPSYDQSGVEYRFVCISSTDPVYTANPSALNSPWQSATGYTVSGVSIGTPGNQYRFQLSVRDKSSLQNQATPTSIETVFLAPPPRVLEVPYPYATINAAIDAANDGDTIVVKPGVYTGGNNRNLDFQNKAITIRSENPDSPSVVAATIIDCQGSQSGGGNAPRRAFVFQSGEGRGSVVNGFTIINAYAVNSPKDVPSNDDEANGKDALGGAIFADNGSSPTILNCVIRDCYAQGQDGRRGVDGEDGQGETGAANGERGGNGGIGFGGAMYFGTGSRPMIRNVKIQNTFAISGNAGNGGTGGKPAAKGGDGGNAKRAYGGAIYFDDTAQAEMIDVTMQDCRISIGQRGSGGLGGEIDQNSRGDDGVSGSSDLSLGGAVYAGIDGVHVLTRCFFTGNRSTQGYGGAIFNDDGVTMTLHECTFTMNRSIYSGGAIYADDPRLLAINSTQFSSNSSFLDEVQVSFNDVNGGAIAVLSSTPHTGEVLTITDCLFNGNRAALRTETTLVNGAGGAIDVQGFGLYPQVSIRNSKFIGHSAEYGGVLSAIHAEVNIDRSEFENNSAEYGGAVFGVESYLGFANSSFVRNQADPIGSSSNLAATGGAFYVLDSALRLANNTFVENSSQYAGGALYATGSPFYMPVSTYSDQQVINCLFVDNQAGVGGGAIAAMDGAELQIKSSTIYGNNVTELSGFGGGVSCGYSYQADDGSGLYFYSYMLIENSILWNNEAVFGRQAAVGDPVMFYNPPSTIEFYHSDIKDGVGQVYTGYPDGNPRAYDSGGNINADPLFVQLGPLNPDDATTRTFFLSQRSAGQSSDSPCLDAGFGAPADLAESLGLEEVSTRTDLGADTDALDIGYHYEMNFETIQPILLVSVVEGNGTVTPASGTTFPLGTVVTLLATPSDSADAVKWLGTDDDTSTRLVNTVTMTKRKDVQVRFYRPRVFNVTGDFTDLQNAIDLAVDGDVIIMHPGQYELVQASYVVIDKAITLQSYKPDDPGYGGGVEIVGKHLIVGSEVSRTPLNIGFFVLQGTGRDTIINGITFRDVSWTGRNGCPGKDTNCGNPFDDGSNGVSLNGSAIRIADGSSATIKNCRFINNRLVGGNGANGATSGDGGWGGWARGGAIYIGENADPKFINCEFSGNTVRGGDGADAGSDESFGRGGSWENPTNPHSAWDWAPIGGYLEYWKYSGYGGAVYCDFSSKPEFVNCVFADNIAYGGQTGVGDRMAPWSHFKIDRYGGAVYAAEYSEVVFDKCVFENNSANVLEPEAAVEETPYFAFGGAIAFEDNATLRLNDCVFETNEAHHGGAVYYEYGDAVIRNSRFEANTGSFGGALYYTNATNQIENTTFTNNTATASGAQGGAVFAFASDSVWRHIEVLGNTSAGTGGGVFLAGSENDGLGKILGNTEIFNALIAKNTAETDGAGISINWYQTATLQNCTIADNAAQAGVGGGLFCGYHAFATAKDSILWGNTASQGQQLAVVTGADSDPSPSVFNLSFSDIQADTTSIFVGENSTLVGYNPGTRVWDTTLHNFSANPLFVAGLQGNYYLSQLSAGQTQNSPCVDVGSATAFELQLSFLTTSTVSRFDTNLVDLGYHYLIEKAVEICRFSDLRPDGKIDLRDFSELGLSWLDSPCNESNSWCNGADLNFDNVVDINDLFGFTDCWLAADTEKPTPSPSQWVVEPRASDTTIEMSILPSSDSWSGQQVYYYFENLTDPTKSSKPRQNFDPTDTATYVVPPDFPWQWKNEGLASLQTYNYIAYVRDLAGNQTVSTGLRSATAGEDSSPPKPDPAGWQIPPFQSGSTSISMTATAATDTEGNGVEYRFVCASNPELTSGWQQNINTAEPTYVANPRVYEVTGLTAGQTYTFYTISRDRSPNLNQTGQSTPLAEVLISEEVTTDITPPEPDPAAFLASSPFQQGQSGTYYHVMAAEVAEDPSGVEYRFVCVNNGALSSAWRNAENVAGKFFPNGQPQTANTYWVQVGVKNLLYSWTVQYRDRAPTPNVGTISPAKQITNVLP